MRYSSIAQCVCHSLRQTKIEPLVRSNTIKDDRLLVMIVNFALVKWIVKERNSAFVRRVH